MLIKIKRTYTHPKAFRGALRIRMKVLCLSVTPARHSRDEEGEDEDEDEERLIPHTDNQLRSSARPTPASITEKHSHAERRYLTLVCMCVCALN